jgi:hypothetical protein
MVHHRRHLAAREEEIAAIITLFARKEVTPASCSSWRRGVSLSVEITNA